MLFYGGQLTFEEKYVKKYNIMPLNALGLEGTFSLTLLSILLVAFYFIPVQADLGQPGGVLENALDGFVQLGNNSTLLTAYIFTTVVLVCTTLCGINITRKVSAVFRIVFGSLRSLLVWAVTLILGWQKFLYLQLIGFLIITVGVLIFNDILFGKYNYPVLERHKADDSLHSFGEIGIEPSFNSIK